MREFSKWLCPSEFITLRPIKFGLSELVAATWTDIVKRPFRALLGPSGILPRHLSSGLILSKGNLLPCSILKRNPETPSR